jgi:hypothetical protein
VLPKEVWFFHDSMQSYLTAYGLAAEDRQGYQQLPPLGDNRPWDRSRVLLWAAANGNFARAQSDIVLAGGTELFQMCLATFMPRQGLRRWLCDELVRWAEDHRENLRRDDVLKAVPRSLVDQVKSTRGPAKVLGRAARICFDADEAQDSVERLGLLYAGIATLVYEWESAPKHPWDGITPKDRVALINTLCGLAPPDFSRLVAAVPDAAVSVTKNAPVPMQVEELVRWAESSGGLGLEQLWAVAEAVLPSLRSERET